MDNGQYHHMSQGFRTRVEFPPQVRSPLPPPSNVLHQQVHIPYDSSQCNAPPLPPPPLPPPPFVPNTFQNKRTTGAAISQSTTSPNSFQGPSYPTPDFTRPPPSFCPYEKDRQGVSHGVQQGVNAVVTQQDYGCRSMITHQSFGFSTASLPSGVASNQLTHNVPGNDGRNTMNSSCSQHTLRIVSTYEGASSFEKQDDQMWLGNFEQRVLERNGEQKECGTSKKKPIKLIEIQQMVSRSRMLTDRLIQLKERVNLIQSDEGHCWWELITQIEKIKVELDGITQKFQDPLFLKDVRRLIHQRRKKRAKVKKQHKLRVKEKKEQKELWKKEEEKIDAWQERIRQVEEDKRREIAVKMEADTILGEVRQKQVDVVKMQQLLESLISLRIARLNKGAAHGFVATPQQDHLFTMTIKNIAEVVNAQMDEYKLEEQTLRVMMEESTSYRRSNSGKEPKDTVSKLESAIKKIFFGEMASTDQIYDEYTAAEHCLETLVKRRNEWDQFICNEELPLASSVPLSWVIPPSHPAPGWEKFQGQD